jgi:phenylacetate-CoA ligase
LKFILCSYQFVSVVHRRIIERAFGVPVFNFYGSTETGHLLMETRPGEMKASVATVFCEVIEPDARGVGDLVVTTLTNEYMPLVRYRIGDLVERRVQPYATVYRVHGRMRDALRSGEGRRVTTLDVDECFAGVSGVAHYQLRQERDGNCRLKYIPEEDGPAADALADVSERLRALLQTPEEIVAERTDRLPPLPSGKFRLTQPAEL